MEWHIPCLNSLLSIKYYAKLIKWVSLDCTLVNIKNKKSDIYFTIEIFNYYLEM